MSENKKKKRPLDVKAIINSAVFFGFIVIFGILTLVMPKEKKSELENRNLADFPKFSFDNVMNCKFMNGIETYISDHFVGRVPYLKLKGASERFIGRSERNDVYITGERMMLKVTDPDYASVDKSIDAINIFNDGIDAQVYMMLVPTSAAIYSDQLPKNAPNLDQQSFIDYVYGKLDSDIVGIDAYSAMKSGANEYIYYRTDHHWTSLGAYLAYNAAGKKMGYSPLARDSFDIQHASDSFLGTLYSKTLYDGCEPDVIDYWFGENGENIVSMEVNTGNGIDAYDSLYMREYLDKKDKYASFTGTNQPLITIKTKCEDGPKILVIKDSYAHSYVPFLANNYSEITMLDMRYVQTSYKNVVDPENFDQVLILYNVSTFMTDSNIPKLKY